MREPGGDFSTSDQLLTGALLLLSDFLFAPATLWLVEQTVINDQLAHAFIVLGLAGAYLMTERKNRLTLHLRFGNRATALLIASFVVLAVKALLNWPVLILVAYCLAIAGWLLFLFGDHVARPVLALLSAFCGYVFMALILPLFDWPLRSVAGRYSGAFLEWMGKDVELGLAQLDEPKLLLMVDGKIFEVAAECNGFGMFSGCLLLAILLVFLRRIHWFDKILAVGMAAMVGLVFNLGRIIVICLLAPYFPESYFLMHEVVGNVFFWGSLATVWWLVRGFRETDRPSVQSAPDGRHVVFFDGECLMCNRSMRTLMRLDRHRQLLFAPLQGETAREVIERRDDLEFDLKTIIYVENLGQENEKAFLRSTAVLRSLVRTRRGWSSLARFALVVPRPIRDTVYDFVARNRIRWFGRTESCSLIPPERRNQLLP